MVGPTARRLRNVVGRFESALTAEPEAAQQPVEPGDRTAICERLARDPTDRAALRALAALADLPADLAADLARERLRHDGSAEALETARRADPLAAVVLDGQRPVPERYAALREQEATLRMGATIGLWKAVLAETRDGEELARLRDRLRRRWDAVPAPAELPLPAQEGLRAIVERRAGPLVSLITGMAEQLRAADRAAPDEPALRVQARLAEALGSVAAAKKTTAEARRRADAAWRSAHEARERVALRYLAACAEAAGVLARLDPTAGGTDLLGDLRDEILAAGGREHALVRDRALYALAVALVSIGHLDPARRIADEEIVLEHHRCALLAAIAGAIAARPGATAAELRELLEATQPVERRDRLARAVVAWLAALGDIDGAVDALDRVENPQDAVLAGCRLAVEVATRDRERALGIWVAATPEDDPSAAGEWAVIEWQVSGVAVAGEEAERLDRAWRETQERLEGFDAFVAEHARALCCPILCRHQPDGLAEAVRTASSLTYPTARSLALTAVGAARLGNGAARGRRDLKVAGALACGASGGRVFDDGADPLRAWLAAVRGLETGLFSALVGDGWQYATELPDNAGRRAAEGLVELLVDRLGDGVTRLWRRRTEAYRDDLERSLPSSL